MKKLLLFATLILCASTFSNAQVFYEGFDEADNAQAGTAAGTPGGTWSVTTNPTGGAGSFSVQGGVFWVDGTTSEGVWESSAIDISAFGYAVIDLTLVSVGIGFGANDHVEAYYDVGGGQVLFASMTPAIFSGTVEGSAIVKGTSLKIYIKGRDNSFLGVQWFDDVTVTGITTLYSRKNGNWTDATVGDGTWSSTSHTGGSCDCTPNNLIVAVVGNSNTVNMNADGTTGGLEVHGTGTLRYTAADADLNIERGYIVVDANGTIDRNGQNNARINFTNDVVTTSTFNGAVSVDDINLTDDATITMNGTGTLAINDDFYFSADNADVINNMTGASIGDRIEFVTGTTGATFTNNFSISAATVFYGDDNNIVTNASTMTLTSGILGGGAGADGNDFINSAGATFNIVSIDPSGGTFDISNSGTINQTGNFLNIDAASNFNNLNGSVWNWSYVPGTAPDTDMSAVLDCSAATNTFNYNGAGNQTVFGTTYHHVSFQVSGTKSLAAALDANGNLTIQNSAILNSATFNTTIGGNWSVLNSGSFTEGTTTTTFDGTTQSISNASGTETFYNLTFSGSGTKTGQCILDVDNILTISGTAQLDQSANNMTVAGNWVVTSTNADPFVEGTRKVTLDGTGTQTITTVLAAGETFYDLDITVSGNKQNNSILNVSNDINLAGTAQLTANAAINIGRNWTVTSTNANPFVEGGSQTVTFNGSGNQVISTVLAAGETFYNLTISGSGTKSSANIIDVNNNLTVSGTAQLDLSVQDLTVGGNWSVTSTNADPFVEGMRKVTFDGTAAQTISTVLAAGETFYDLEIASSSTKTNNNQINITRNLTIISTARLNAGAAITVGGDWTVTSTNTNPFAQGTQTVTFNGTADQTIQTVLGTETFHNLVLNKVSGGLKLATSPSTDLVIAGSGTMTFTSGILTTTTNESLTFNDEALVSGGSASSFVDGPVIKVGEDPFIFPTGDASTWARFSISPSGATSATIFTVQYRLATPPSNTSVSGISRVSTGEYWELTRSGTISNATTVGLYWENGTNSGINSVTAGDLVVARFDGTNYVSAGGTISGSTTAGNVVSNGITAANIPNNTLRYYTFGSSASLPTNPLPVEFNNFDAELYADQVNLSWSTLTEKNSDYFSVERSSDGDNFTKIGTVASKGNSFVQVDYAFTDYNPIAGRSYYRLKQTDFDGQFEYHPEIKVINYEGRAIPVLEVFPNPNEGMPVKIRILGLKDKQSVPVKFYNQQGQKVLETILDSDDQGLIDHDLALRPVLSPGYYVIMVGNTWRLTRKLKVN